MSPNNTALQRAAESGESRELSELLTDLLSATAPEYSETCFSPTELLRGIYRLVRQAAAGEARIENEYKSVVRPEGNPAAQEMMARVYETCAAEWRGLGTIPASGLRLRDMYRRFDFSAARPLDLPPAPPKKSGCRCGEVLRGKITPKECKLFGTACVPEHAAGPCMVSAEGVCAAWHKYGGGIFQYG